MPRQKKWSSDAERMRAKRAATKAAAIPGVEVAVAHHLAVATDEQAVRDRFGYSASEARSQAERQAAADRILGRPSVPKAREQAAKEGRRYGLEEALRRGELGERQEARIERAEAYALWLHDGPSQRVNPG